MKYKYGKSRLSLLQVTKDYSENASIHGVGYVFSGKTSLERFIWFILVIIALALASHFTRNVYINWQDNPVITSLKVK